MDRALRAYAVGASFSVRDVEDQFKWRPTGRDWDDVQYRRKADRQPASDNRRRAPRRTASAVTVRVDRTKIRTRAEMKAVARSL